MSTSDANDLRSAGRTVPDAAEAHDLSSAVADPPEPARALTADPEVAGLLKQVSARMGVSELDAIRRSLRTMLALYDAKAQGGKAVVRYDRAEQLVILPGTS